MVPGSEEEQTFWEAEEHRLSVKHEIQNPAENEQNKSQLSIKFSKERAELNDLPFKLLGLGKTAKKPSESALPLLCTLAISS